MNELRGLGWDSRLEEDFRARARAGWEPARVVGAIRRQYRLLFPGGEVAAGTPSGRLRYKAEPGELPVVGDWVAARRTGDGPSVVQDVLPRRTTLVRTAAGTASADQVLAANVDVTFLVTACGHDWNARRLERYLTVAWEAGTRPVVVLSKIDGADDLEALLAEVRAVAPGVEVIGTCALDGRGVDRIRETLPAGWTGALLGSSGVGKSTLVNALLDEELQDTCAVRESDHRGRHTTTRRDLLALPWGAWLVDTPGLREVALSDASTGVAEAFRDIEALIGRCRFRDCRHAADAGCAVQEALESGELPGPRWKSYRKLLREAGHVAREKAITRRKREGRRRRR